MSSSPSAVLPPFRPIRVLIVDADPRVRSALRATMSSEPDLELLAAVPDAAAALAGAGVLPPVVALVDVSPPNDSSLDLVGLLSRRPGWRVVAMSVRGSAQTAAAAAGAAAFVVKGDDVETVLSSIRTAAFSA